jgi:hypothetical protein
METAIAGRPDACGTLAYTPNTAYRINVFMNQDLSKPQYMTVCADGPGGAVLGTFTGTGVSGQFAQNNAIKMGITGEEPSIAGYTYYWRNAVFSTGGQYSATSCF